MLLVHFAIRDCLTIFAGYSPGPFLISQFSQILITLDNYLHKKFFCLCEVYRAIRDFSLTWSPLPVNGCKFVYLCSALMIIEQWGYFNDSHLLWHGPTLYNGHLRGPVTLTPVAVCMAVELSLPIRSVATGDRTPISRMGCERSTSTPPRRS